MIDIVDIQWFIRIDGDENRASECLEASEWKRMAFFFEEEKFT